MKQSCTKALKRRNGLCLRWLPCLDLRIRRNQNDQRGRNGGDYRKWRGVFDRTAGGVGFGGVTELSS
ncbi:MAG: hypothetical protein RIB01_09270 [Balneola sp.]